VRSLKECLSRQQLFAFNIWDFVSAAAVMEAAAECGCDIILQTSVKVFARIEKELLRGYVDRLSDGMGICGYLHLDHCRDLSMLHQAAVLGWDSVMLDASHLPLEENIARTNEAAALAHRCGALLEAEVGSIPGAEDGIEGAARLASLDEVVRFAKETEVDLLAAAVGTCHGITDRVPAISHDLIDCIGTAIPLPLVIHGGSGLLEEDYRALLAHSGVRKINISTELKLAYRNGLQLAIQRGLLERHPFDQAPVREMVKTALKAVVKEKLRFLKG